jgi:hypothetical protein
MSSAENKSGNENGTSTGELCWAYDPLPSQSEFQGLRTRLKGFSGPVGSGKSAALCFEAIRQSYLNRGRQGLLAAPTLAMLRDATVASLLQMLDRLDVGYEIRKADGELALPSSRSIVLLRSLDEPERLRGTNLAWFGIDELSYAREEGWLRLEARLRDPKAGNLCGFGVWTPQGNDWIYERFVHEPVEGYGCVRAKPFENRFLLEKTPDYYERLESSYDPRFYRQEVLGEYVNSRSDRVYHCFAPAVHVSAQHYVHTQPLLWSLDFNVAPMTSVLAQMEDGKLRIIDEIVLERATTEEACQEFENRYRQHAGRIDVFGDASGRNMHTTGTSDYTMLQNYLFRAGFRNLRLRVPQRNPPVLNRVQKVNAMLTNALGEVRLEIDPKCKELIKDLEEVMFKPESGVIDKLRDLRRTHASDALGYMVWELFGDKPPAGEMGQRLF